MAETQAVDTSNPRWRKLASHALWHAVYLRGEQAAEAVNAIQAEFGADAVVQAALSWIDTAFHHAGIDTRTGMAAGLAFVREDGDGTIESADDVPPDVAWAGRVIVARLNNDEPQFAALMLAHTDDEQYGMGLQRLLGSCALIIRGWSPEEGDDDG